MIPRSFALRTWVGLALATVTGIGALWAQEPAIPVASQSPSASNMTRSSDDYTPAFARIRYEEGGLSVTRRDGTQEELSYNDPVFAGDKLLTGENQRAEVQLPVGGIIRLNSRCSLEIFELGDPSAGQSATLIGLGEGSLAADVLPLEPGQDFRIDTPAASVYPLEDSSFRVDIEEGDAVRVSVLRGRVEVAGEEGSVTLEAGERTRVRPGGTPKAPWDFNVVVRDGFDSWVARRDDVFHLRQRPGKEYDALPSEVRPYYNELSSYGRWVYLDDMGWVWQPDVENDWQPYVRGSWRSGPYGPVWVGVEPWSWSVYRYGRWNWSLSIGWVWIPGAIFSPAHVYWYYGSNMVGWAALDYWDRPICGYPGWGWDDPWFNGCGWHFVYWNDLWHHHHHHDGDHHPGGQDPGDDYHFIPRDRVVHMRDGWVDRRGVVGRSGGVDFRPGTRLTDQARADMVRRIQERSGPRTPETRRPIDLRSAKDNPLARRVDRPGPAFRDLEKPLIRERRVTRGGDRAVASPENSVGSNPPSRAIPRRVDRPDNRPADGAIDRTVPRGTDAPDRRTPGASEARPSNPERSARPERRAERESPGARRESSNDSVTPPAGNAPDPGRTVRPPEPRRFPVHPSRDAGAGQDQRQRRTDSNSFEPGRPERSPSPAASGEERRRADRSEAVREMLSRIRERQENAARNQNQESGNSADSSPGRSSDRNNGRSSDRPTDRTVDRTPNRGDQSGQRGGSSAGSQGSSTHQENGTRGGSSQGSSGSSDRGSSGRSSDRGGESGRSSGNSSASGGGSHYSGSSGGSHQSSGGAGHSAGSGGGRASESRGRK